MNTKKNRRDFLKNSALLSSGAILGQAHSLHAAAPEKQAPPANETLKTLHKLRTIHGNFTERAVPDEQIEQILGASIRAANSSNMQTYSIVVVKDRRKMKQVCQYEGGCLLLYCVDYNRLKAGASSLGHPFYPDSIVHFVTACINTAFAAQTAVIAARSLGLDCLTTNGIHRGNMERVWNLLELPAEHCFPLIAVVIGHPTQEPDHLRGRLGGVGVIHRETYHKSTSEELEAIARQYDDKERHIALNDNWGQQGHQHYLDWLFKVWLKRDAEPTEEETQMLAMLKRCGFVEA
jgi:nitroreductase